MGGGDLIALIESIGFFIWLIAFVGIAAVGLAGLYKYSALGPKKKQEKSPVGYAILLFIGFAMIVVIVAYPSAVPRTQMRVGSRKETFFLYGEFSDRERAEINAEPLRILGFYTRIRISNPYGEDNWCRYYLDGI